MCFTMTIKLQWPHLIGLTRYIALDCSQWGTIGNDWCIPVVSRVPFSVAKSAQIMSIFIFLLFKLRYLPDHLAILHQIFQEDGKWAAIKKLSYWFLNSIRAGREVGKGHCRFRPSFRKCNIVAKQIYLLQKESCVILSG